MAGTRPSDKPHISAGSPLAENDAIFISNPAEDRNLDFEMLQKMLRDGTGLETAADKDNLTFPTRREFTVVTTPDGGSYRISNGKIEFLNPDDSQWYTIAVAKSGGKTLKWKTTDGTPLEAVSVNSAGVIQYPANFISANNIVTSTGGQLAAISAGAGLVGQSFNGTSAKTWIVDSSWVTAIANAAITAALANLNSLKLKTADNSTVELRVKIKNGVPTLSPTIVS